MISCFRLNICHLYYRLRLPHLSTPLVCFHVHILSAAMANSSSTRKGFETHLATVGNFGRDARLSTSRVVPWYLWAYCLELYSSWLLKNRHASFAGWSILSRIALSAHVNVRLQDKDTSKVASTISDNYSLHNELISFFLSTPVKGCFDFAVDMQMVEIIGTVLEMSINIKSIRESLRRCEFIHGERYIEVSDQTPGLSMFLLVTHGMNIVAADSGSSYVALPYVWVSHQSYHSRQHIPLRF
jgi:hypothetical protein